MASARDTATFFTEGSSSQFEHVLSLYPQALRLKAETKNKKPEELIILDNWYQNELPKKIKSRGKDAHLIHEELVKLMKWKQTVNISIASNLDTKYAMWRLCSLYHRGWRAIVRFVVQFEQVTKVDELSESLSNVGKEVFVSDPIIFTNTVFEFCSTKMIHIEYDCPHHMLTAILLYD